LANAAPIPRGWPKSILRRDFYPLASEHRQVWSTAMKIGKRQVDGITVVILDGRLDSSASGEVMDQLSGLVNAGATRMILNLESLTYISSAGLRSILVAAKLTKTLNGDMRMCEASDLVSQILETCGFSNLIKIDAHEEDSIKALGGNL
jgi:anti-sigma B factor antagonist